MPPRPQFSIDESVEIVAWWYELKDIHTARSPDQAPCDFWLWSICKAEVRRVKPKTLDDLMEVVSDFVASLDPAEVRRAVRDVRPELRYASKWTAGILSLSSRNIKEGPLRSKNISTA